MPKLRDGKSSVSNSGGKGAGIGITEGGDGDGKNRRMEVYAVAPGSDEERKQALRLSLERFATSNIDGKAYVFIQATFPSSVVYEVYQPSCEEHGGESKSELWHVDYKGSKKSGRMRFEFSNLRRTRAIAQFEDEKPVTEDSFEDVADSDGGSQGAGAGVEKPAATTEVSTIVDVEAFNLKKLCVESVLEANKREVTLYGRLMLESGDVEAARKAFESEGVIRGRVPVMNISKYTANGNRYTAKAASHLERDIQRLQSSRKNGKILELTGGPWPTGAMMASHGAAKGPEGPDRFFSITAQITGTVRARVESDEWLFVTFETLRTTAGKDMATMLLDTPHFVPGVSLRGFAKEETANDRGGFDVDRLEIKGFGVDFTHNPAMPGVREIGVELTESQDDETTEGKDSTEQGGLAHIRNTYKAHVGKKKGKKMNLQELIESLLASEDAKEQVLGKQLKAMQESGANADELKAKMEEGVEAQKKLRVYESQDAQVKVVSEFAETVKKDDAVSEAGATRLAEGAKGIVERHAKTLLEERSELDAGTPQFKDALSSAVNKELTESVDAYKDLVGAELKARNITEAGEGREVEESLDLGPNAPNLNTLPESIRCLEEDNEMVGLPTGRKDARGKIQGPDLKEALMSAAWGIPMYERDEQGGPVNVMLKYMPEKYRAVRQVNKNYRKEAFVHNSMHGVSWTDDMLRENKETAHILKMLESRERLEATWQTTALGLGTIYPQIRSAIVESAFALSQWLAVATLNPVSNPEFEIWTERYERDTQITLYTFNKTGDVETDGSVPPMKAAAFIKVTTIIAGGDLVVDITYKNENGVSRTVTATVSNGTAAGTTLYQIRPLLNGEKFTDVTAVAPNASNAATSGIIDIVCFKELNQGSETTLSGYTKIFLDKTKATVEEFDLGFEMTWRLVEDALRGMSTGGPGRYDAASALIRAMARDFAVTGDRRGFAALNTAGNHDTSNDLTFDADPAYTGIPTGWDHKNDWLPYLHNYLVRANTGIRNWSTYTPDKLVIAETNLERLLWIHPDLIVKNPSTRGEEFFSALAWGSIARMKVFAASEQNTDKMVLMNSGNVTHNSYIPLEFHGPFTFPERNKTNVYVARSRTKDQFIQSKSRGIVTIKNADKVA